MRFTESSALERRREEENLELGGQDGNKPPSTVGLRDRLAHFTWPWFACTMSTGALAVVVAQTPNQFTGLQTIGKIFFIADVVLFSLFNILMATRFFLKPKKLLLSLHHPVEGLFFGAYWVSIALILNCTQLYDGPSTGPWLTKAMEVCFWLYCGVVFIVGVGQYYIFFQDERLNVADAMPAWIFPIYPVLVVGPLAGILIQSQPTEAGWRMWIGAVALQGMGWAVAFIMYCMYMQRLMGAALPSPSTRPGMFVSVGPAGYTATALFSLGMAAPNVVPADQFTDSVPDGNFIKNLGVMAGFFLILFSFWFFCVSSVAVLTGVRRMSFTLNWWAFVFPNAGLTLAIIQAGSALRSPAVNCIASVLTVLLVGFWFLVAGFHGRALWRGEILWPGKDEDKTMKE
ncbi:hypothetical protein P154DRAFT_525599 [Amniculicola lignicola CBS 123094]|uniref:Malic acid transport protein n=1 Tax=Amniculicola lignicola CBS 123094 TaxID=1392246 RepID=A0A6A5W8N8_9PLEO|nr:hypothetical protein P154DRAFT_525599 [Amniculicola lignicola CBS 123094]